VLLNRIVFEGAALKLRFCGLCWLGI